MTALPMRVADPPRHPLVDLRCCSCTDVEWPEADLDVADPPWTYSTTLRDQYGDLNPTERAQGKPSIPRYTTGSPSDHYSTLSVDEIRTHLERMRGRRLALWLTWPLVGGWMAATHDDGRWWSRGAPKSGGAWTKSRGGDRGHYGPGHHWAGCSEPVLVYAHPKAPNDKASPLRNAWIEKPGAHSHKPARWMAQWIRRWVPEGGLVCDPYAGLGSVAEAVLLAGGGRRYLGTEIDAERHGQALALLAQTRVAS